MIDFWGLSGAITAHGRVVRIMIADHKGSAPRETGTSMLVHDKGTLGTIGGGRLELDAMARAVAQLGDGPAIAIRRQPLGPSLGQCCGGSVTLVAELWDAARLAAAEAMAEAEGCYARRVEGAADRPARRGALLSHGWLVEPVHSERQAVFIYGAGHLGAALAGVLAPMPRFEVFVADTRAEFLDALAKDVQALAAPPHEAMAAAPAGAAHFIMTPEHDYDLELCHRLLQRQFVYGGLIGSATKWARFRKRLAVLGHTPTVIDQIECPIGEPSLGKHPQEIAVGVAARLLAAKSAHAAREDVA